MVPLFVINKTETIHPYYVFYVLSDTWIIYLLQFVFVLCAGFGSLVGIINCKKHEELSILSKPIRRNDFIFGKVLSSGIWSCIFAFIVCLVFLILFLSTLDKTHSMFSNHNSNIFGLMLSLIIITVFASTISNTLGYLANHVIAFLIPVALIGIYVIVFPYVATIDDGYDLHQLLYSSVGPLFLLPIGTIIFVPLLKGYQRKIINE
ncbi:MAG: hypothetical protein LBJ97_02380 [Mycoplasmataceae bacterium]|nr:hypothetical protein [Mycoplasmataceae bacterium]